MDENTSKLFVEINPNIDQLAKEQEGLRPSKTPNSIANEVVEGVKGEDPLLVDEDKIFDEAPMEKPKLTRQRAKKAPSETPTLSSVQLEREERKRIREAEAKAKAIAKEEKRIEGQERNRQKARERYRRIAEEKKQKKGLAAKAEKSGMPIGILRKVYNRGMAAWKTGHRPGTTPQQWAFARVNSFTTKSKGTWGGADKDLAAKV